MRVFHFKRLPEQCVLNWKGRRRRQPQPPSQWGSLIRVPAVLAGEGARLGEGTRSSAGSLLLNKRGTSLCTHKSDVRVGSRSFALFTEGWLQAQAAQVTAQSPSLLQAHPVIPDFKIPRLACSVITSRTHAVATSASSGPRF